MSFDEDIAFKIKLYERASAHKYFERLKDVLPEEMLNKAGSIPFIHPNGDSHPMPSAPAFSAISPRSAITQEVTSSKEPDSISYSVCVGEETSREES